MGDLISRKWLMECVEEGWIKFETEKDENKFIHLVRDTAPSAQQWIPCSERLPEENKAILLGVKYKDDFKMFVTARMDITYWQGLGRDIKCQEMRWMPLPEPWKGEDDE